MLNTLGIFALLGYVVGRDAGRIYVLWKRDREEQRRFDAALDRLLSDRAGTGSGR